MLVNAFRHKRQQSSQFVNLSKYGTHKNIKRYNITRAAARRTGVESDLVMMMNADHKTYPDPHTWTEKKVSCFRLSAITLQNPHMRRKAKTQSLELLRRGSFS